MKKVGRILAYSGKTFAPGLSILVILSIMVLGFSTLVGEASGGSSNIDASGLDTVDISTQAASCKVTATSPGRKSVECGADFCQIGSDYSVRVKSPSGSTTALGTNGWLNCDITFVEVFCNVASLGKHCATVGTSTHAGIGRCFIDGQNGVKKASTTCTRLGG